MKENNFDFEKAIEKLNTIADKLENGNESLEESINLFEEGMELSKKCSEFLSGAEKRITILINEDEKIKEKDFLSE